MKRLKGILDVTTNVVVVVFAVVAIGVLVKNYFAPRGAETSAVIQKGSVFPVIAGFDYKQSPRNLILALNVHCRYCTKSVPFYNRLEEVRRENAGQSTSWPCSSTRTGNWLRVMRRRSASRCKRSRGLS